MMRRLLHRLTALVAACSLIFAISFPSMAGGDESYFIDMAPGDYTMTYLRFNVPNPGDEAGIETTSRLYGPDVDTDGTLILEQGKYYTFYYEQTMPYGHLLSYGFRAQLQAGFNQLTGSADYYIPIDGKTMFALPTDGGNVSVKISFSNVSLDSWLSVHNDGGVYGPTVELNGQITIEVTTMIDGYFTIPESSRELTYDNIGQYEEELITILDEHAAAAREGSQVGTLFDEPQELTYRIDLDGQMIGFGAHHAETALTIGFSMIGEQDYTVNFQRERYVTAVRDEASGGVDFNSYSMDCTLIINALDWIFVPREGGEAVSPSPPDSTVTAAKAVTVTVGAGAAALGGSALVNVLGDAVGSAASNMLVPDPTVIDPTAINPATVDPSRQTPAGSDLPEADLPADKKKKRSAGEEITDTENIDNEEELPAVEEQEIEETASEEQEIDEMPTEMPEDLPEEDSPEVSMSLYAPGSDLLNIKGGAADLTITIDGGEGYVWNYLPAVIAPGAAKAIIPTVIGRSELATLALNLTGAATEKRHHVIFVNVIAWTTTASGKVLKASASKEMKLHTPGIEAKQDAKGNITVTAYSDTTLKGYAEIRKLSAEEYILEVMEDESITIHANDVKLGTTSLKK